MSEATLNLKCGGKIILFECGKRKFENVHWRHHLRMYKGCLVVDGCVFAEWKVDETPVFIYECDDDDTSA